MWLLIGWAVKGFSESQEVYQTGGGERVSAIRLNFKSDVMVKMRVTSCSATSSTARHSGHGRKRWRIYDMEGTTSWTICANCSGRRFLRVNGESEAYASHTASA
ncbi:hypothetical protein TREMEDRAFT_57194 [Tremella mesenterica DSM 1558]|uniref:uncharacterized protein n=1 Tax=Tremella mesenterica (strain ATCC 24925 / CBS 8224 / DSM 1558 / NBRC 9311 / NRRL Y-6157 / RJB 2259-6 / UBC 559-6) TaxID=578456 RepID=UPI0003F48F63|nr:uncharacterized protein TREMEDRAFT_57194 [Tremella mesenterica DSM 1558]EIW68694.1 hypothetical protein TREMEDRAFT_57194 [Tremella mesenterica DSM 1558]